MSGSFHRTLLTLLASLLLAGAAMAQPYTVETVGHRQRTHAEAACALAVAEGIPAEVVRSFRRGKGWVFLVRVQGLEDRDAAAAAAQRLAQLSGIGAQVFLVAGRDVLPVEELAAAAPNSAPGDSGVDVGEGPEAAATDAQAARAEGARLLSALVLAHGGGGSADQPPPRMADWDPVHFRYERAATIDDSPLRAWHDYHRDGDALRLEIRIIEGEGTDSVTIVRGDQAWLMVGGEVHEVPAGPTREALALFEPATVLEQAVGFSGWSADMGVRAVERPEGDEELSWIALQGEDDGERVSVGLDPTDQRARQLVMSAQGAELSWSFADYQEISDGLVVPLRLRSSFDGKPREQIVVRTLELPESLDAELFVPKVIENP